MRENSYCGIFEIGFGRSASRSVCEAFHLLGLRVQHGLGECKEHRQDAIEKLQTGDWDWDLYTTCNVASNISSVHWYQLYENLPAAKFVLTIRPTELWLNSWKGRLHSHAKKLRQVRKNLLAFQPCRRLIQFGMVGFNRNEWGRQYEEHNQKVINTIEPEQLLVLNVWTMTSEELWQKVAGFVGQDPPNIPFPKLGRQDKVGLSKRLKETKQ